MNLFDCHLKYFVVPIHILSLKSKPSILAAIHAYRQKSIEGLVIPSIHTATRHARRKVMEITRDLVDLDVVNQVNGELVLLDMDVKVDLDFVAIRIPLPSNFEYSLLSTTALRLLMLLHHQSRYNRKSYLLIVKQADLAKQLQTNRSRIRDAIKQLKEHYLLRTDDRNHRRKVKRDEGTKLMLLDPESSASLYDMGKRNIDGIKSIPVHDRYRYVLSRYDPRCQLENMLNPVASHKTRCPLCEHPSKTPSKQATLTFNSVEDWWKCARCGRGGRSEQIWHKLTPYSNSASWMSTVAELTGNAGITKAPEPPIENWENICS